MTQMHAKLIICMNVFTTDICFSVEKHGKGSGIPKRLQPFIADMNHELSCMHYSLHCTISAVIQIPIRPDSMNKTTLNWFLFYKQNKIINLDFSSDPIDLRFVMQIGFFSSYRDTLFPSKIWFDTHFIFQLSNSQFNLLIWLHYWQKIKLDHTLHHACIHITSNTNIMSCIIQNMKYSTVVCPTCSTQVILYLLDRHRKRKVFYWIRLCMPTLRCDCKWKKVW